jgi:hypothetical protein
MTLRRSILIASMASAALAGCAFDPARARPRNETPNDAGGRGTLDATAPDSDASADAGGRDSSSGPPDAVAIDDAAARPDAMIEDAKSAPPDATPADAMPPPPPAPLLSVSGSAIVDETGRPVRLLGVNRVGTEYQCVLGQGIFDGPNDGPSVDAIKTWHATAVRILLNEECWLGINGAPALFSGANYQQAIADYVALVESRGMYPILDLQWSASALTLPQGQDVMANADHTPDFWDSVATRFKDDGRVVFELFTEPDPDSGQDTTAAWQCWRDGGACPGVNFAVAGMQTLVTAVRNTGARNLLLLGGVQRSNSLTEWLAYKPIDPRNNIAPAWHVYQNHDCTQASCFGTQVPASLSSAFPIVASDVGEDDCMTAVLDPTMAFMDQLHGHYVAWLWNVRGDCESLISDYATAAPNGVFGQAFHDHLMQVAP